MNNRVIIAPVLLVESIWCLSSKASLSVGCPITACVKSRLWLIEEHECALVHVKRTIDFRPLDIRCIPVRSLDLPSGASTTITNAARLLRFKKTPEQWSVANYHSSSDTPFSLCIDSFSFDDFIIKYSFSYIFSDRKKKMA
jgi:hypothetical protein